MTAISDASSRMFGHPIPADLDPAMLMAELRALRPLMTELHQARETIAMLQAFTPGMVQELRDQIERQRRLQARLEDVDRKIDRIDELIQLLDELDVVVRRQ